MSQAAAKAAKDAEGFRQEAAGVMNAPYWATPAEADPRKQVELAMARARERDALADALRSCKGYSGLPARARAIYDRARATIR